MKFETSEEICKIVCSCKNYSEIFRNFPKKQLPCFTDAADHYNKCRLKFSQESFRKFQYGIWNCYFVNLIMAQTPIRKFFGSSTELCLGELLFYFPTSTLNV